MRKLLAVLLSLSVTATVFAEHKIVKAEPKKEVPLQEKIVELHITFAPPSSVEVKKQRKAMMKSKTGQGICSGSFVSELGHIITARHCVQDSTDVEAVLYDGQEYRAEVVALSKGQDLAIVQIGKAPTPFFELSPTVTVGERIAIIGSPLGITNLITEGIVSKLNGDITFLDCTALPGNSGGPVINTNGELVGVVSAMIVVFFGPAHSTIAQSINSINYFFYEIMNGKYSGR